MNFIKLIILIILPLTTFGCSYYMEIDYYSPVWDKNSSKVYCVETEIRVTNFSIASLHGELHTYLVSISTNSMNIERLFELFVNNGGYTTSDDGDDFYIHISIVDDKVFYHINMKSEEDGIYSVGIDGTNNEKISDGSYPEISPNGEKVAYFSGNKLWTMKNDGTEKSEIYDVNYVYSLSWSTDSYKIAVSTESGIEIININTLASNPIEGVERCFAFDWTPDGNDILYVESSSLRMIGIDGSNDRLITEEFSFKSIQISPNGNKIVGTQVDRGDYYGRAVWTTNIDGSNSSVLAIPYYESTFLFSKPWNNREKLITKHF